MRVAPLWKLPPLILSVCPVFDPGTGFGDTLLMVGAAFEADTVKLKATELTLPGFATATVQVPASPPLLKAVSTSWPELMKLAAISIPIACRYSFTEGCVLHAQSPMEH